MPGEYMEEVEEQQLAVDKNASLPDKSQRVKHLVDIGKDYQGYNYHIKVSDNHEYVTEQSDTYSDKDPLDV